VDKQRLTTLINNPKKLEERDFKELANLKNEFPYFQALSPLITIGSKKHKPESEKKHLQSAAIYALDRKQLKHILSGDATSPKLEVAKKPAAPLNSKPKATDTSASSHLPESFFQELFKEMEELKAEKENYQKTLEKFESKEASTTKKPRKASAKKTVTSKSPAKKKNTTTKAKKATTAKKATASKKSTTAKAKTSNKKNAAEKPAKTTSTAKKKPKKDEHDIIQEITSKKELKISDAHKKEQLNIINNFIENEPVLTKRLDTDNQSNKQEAEDLSANSTNLSDDVVSETLAKLMIKQGRKQKAIDIYKKLIWKFPQKKTYFVEIIDELKKES